MEIVLSKRSQCLFNSSSFMSENGEKMSAMKQYDSANARDGFLNLGVAENRLVNDLLIDRFTRQDMQQWLPEYHFYFDGRGIYDLRKALAEFFQQRFVKGNPLVSIDPSNIVVINGAGPCFASLSYCIADPGDYFLMETPYYSVISFDINCLTDNHVYFVHSKSENNFIASVEDYEFALTNARRENKKIKGIFIVTPGNPIGTFSSKERLLSLLNMAKKHELHVVVDEIYANCVYDEAAKFESILSFFNEIPDPQHTHFMWSFSKDFCSAGLRCGAIYSQNDYFVKTIGKLGAQLCPSYAIQHKLSMILNDKVWLNTFFETNHERMRKGKELMVKELAALDCKILDTNSCFFIFVDFRRILSPDLDPRKLTYEREKLLYEMIFNNGVYIVPGQALDCIEPGWFRVVFCAPDDYIIEGVKRIKIACEKFIQS